MAWYGKNSFATQQIATGGVVFDLEMRVKVELHMELCRKEIFSERGTLYRIFEKT